MNSLASSFWSISRRCGSLGSYIIVRTVNQTESVIEPFDVLAFFAAFSTVDWCSACATQAGEDGPASLERTAGPRALATPPLLQSLPKR